ncbi:MAG TPA: HDIG domain-containing protein [bacterium]|nr:HDIG domain-containing protein [bacterium]
MNVFDRIDTLPSDYRMTVASLLGDDVVRSMASMRHHDRTTLEHSLAVSTLAYRAARRLRLNARATARGALLHDFFLYDRRQGHNPHHPTRHARVALQNAQARFALEAVEADIILTHMWPIGGPFYSYKESVLVSIVDKIVSSREVFFLFMQTVSRIFRLFASRLVWSMP